MNIEKVNNSKNVFNSVDFPASHSYVECLIDELDGDSINDNKIGKVAENSLSTFKEQYQPLYISNKKPYIPEIINYLSNIEVDHLQLLGSGQFKKVYKTSYTFNEKEKGLAIAAIKSDLNAENNKAFALEQNTVIEIAPKHIKGLMPVYGILKNKDTNQEIFVSKLCQGELGKKFTDLNQLDKLKAIQFAWRSVHSLHDSGYTHRDIKASNFLFNLSKSGAVKIYLSDFGLISKSNAPREGLRVNFSVLDPNAYKQYMKWKKSKSSEPDSFTADPKSDTWAFGLMICQLLRSSDPTLAFDSDNSEEIESVFANWRHTGSKKTHGKSQEEVRRFIDETPFDTHPALKKLVEEMMAYYPEERPSDNYISEILAGLM